MLFQTGLSTAFNFQVSRPTNITALRLPGVADSVAPEELVQFGIDAHVLMVGAW